MKIKRSKMKIYLMQLNSKVDRQFKEYPRFNQVAGTLPLLNFDSSILQDTLEK